MKPLILTLLLLSLTYSGLSAAQTCNPNIIADAPDSRYYFSPFGTLVFDKKTKQSLSISRLTWMRCALGQSWTGSTCTGSPRTYTWKNALLRAESTVFAGFTDWRLPNRKELDSLVEHRCYSPAINLTAFPNAPSVTFWSSSPNANYSGYAWIVDFDSGDDYNGPGNGPYAVRLVRGGQ